MTEGCDVLEDKFAVFLSVGHQIGEVSFNNPKHAVLLQRSKWLLYNVCGCGCFCVFFFLSLLFFLNTCSVVLVHCV